MTVNIDGLYGGTGSSAISLASGDTVNLPNLLTSPLTVKGFMNVPYNQIRYLN